MKKIKDKYIIFTIIIALLFIIMLIVFFQNISLKLKRNELNRYLDEYKALKEEIDYLNHINENYEIIEKNNQDLENKKLELENRIKQLNGKISNLNTGIEKLK